MKKLVVQPFSLASIKGFLSADYELQAFLQYLPDIDRMFHNQDCRTIKDIGNIRTAVVFLDLGEERGRYVFKQFRSGGPLGRIRGTLGRSKADRVWEVSRRLYVNDVPVPKPVAMVEEKRKGLLLNSCFFSRFVEDSVNLGAYVHSSGTRFMDDGVLVSNLGRAIGTMHLANFIHGDLKWSNLLVRDVRGKQEPVFVDLDHVTYAKSLNNPARAKDLARFMADSQEKGLSGLLKNLFLDAYFDSSEIGIAERDSFLNQMEKTKDKIINRHNKSRRK